MESNEEKAEDRTTLLDYLIILAKHKKLIVALTLISSIIAAVYSLSLPNLYKAETKVLALGESGGGSFLFKEISSLIGMNSSGGSGFNDISLIEDIMESRTIYDKMIDRFDLMNIYETDSREDARGLFSGSVEVKNDGSSRIMTITILDKEPALAASMANALVEEVKGMMQGLAITAASQKRLFFETKLKEIKANLMKSEEAMRAFQEKTGALKVEDQARASIESIANMRGQIAAREVELKVMKTYSTSNNPDLQMLEETLLGLKLELRKLEQKSEGSSSTLMPTGNIPEVGMDYFRKLRDLKFNESLFEVISQQYEMASIAEAKEPGIIQVIDKAEIPERRFKPKRRKIVMIAAYISFSISVFMAFLMEYMESHQSVSSINRKKTETLKQYMSFKKAK